MTNETPFSKNAEMYRDEKVFAEGEDLGLMMKTAECRADDRVLDIGAGAGHTALAFSPYVQECVGIDATKEMVEVASSFAQEKGAGNVLFQQGTAESLPFPDESFDIITCRYAAHHFSDIRKAVSEVARVLKKDGRFLLVDHYAPEDLVLDEFVNHLNRLRDPSHVRESSLSEWQSMFTAHQLGYQEVQKWNLPIQYESWIQRGGTPADREKQIIAHLHDISDDVRDMFCIKWNQNGHPDSFCLKAIFIQGVK
ncbi:class I SAM-dependent methyltransferase [Bacillus vallismortis]|uniref:class I SAM-dependent methyltransferase n=1 Tax=Bacillus vallismortis TaxID=72361 RepID=UPI0002885856|nr:class I SAM-dependent methyltransferase [Bacillus vallismortis]MBG9769838.1 methyltransferase [Bacillus vallismortis]MCI3986358.1 class I SAM-dependent methyltransferase [Bacillus vallismortis]MCY8534907.1 class I SAM-dependent methyltransferase [Bacillus vallismortis]MCY8544511.1 class I SAM-dependent methyltransferase [Bacillus vallismortis]MEC1270069.1 class I SAM-dependent methyltransferase [Bacillus vallismortis]